MQFLLRKNFYLDTITFILSLKIVTSLHLQGSVNLLLTSMAAIDFLLLVCSILLFGIPSVSDYYREKYGNTTAADFNILYYGLGVGRQCDTHTPQPSTIKEGGLWCECRDGKP